MYHGALGIQFQTDFTLGPGRNMSKKSRRQIPVFKTPIIETHCHLDYLKGEDLETTLARSRQVGIERVITIAVSPDNLAPVRTLAQTLPNVWGTQGIHPHEAASYNDAVAREIKTGLGEERIIAVGEIGLDYYYDHADRNIQRDVFEQQLQIASEYDLPVVIHTRDADTDTLDILRNFSNSLPSKGVIHSFTSGIDLARFCLEEGFCLGFNGITTFNKADNVREVVAITPVEQLILETDAPYLTPVPYRGKPNAPYYLPFIAEFLAQLKGLEIEDFLQRTYDNSIRLFFSQEMT
jgi:TatD DNase family protein